LSDVNHLGFLDGIFDGCRAERLFQHLDRPERALSEMIRVVRSAAYVVVVEPDYGTLVIVGADRTVTRKILDYRCTHFRSGRIGRDLFAMYKSQGLEEVALRLLTFVCTNIALGGERALLRRYLDEARQAGVVTEMEGAYWLRDLEAAGQAGIYRHAITVFLVRGKKP
jgi:SAM-dependent methyltransferase